MIRNSVASLNMPTAASPLSGRLAPWWTRALVQKQRPQGIPTGTDFENVTLLIPVLRKGQVLVKVLLLSCDPYLRPGMNDWREPMMSEDSPPDVFGGYGVGMVIESCDANFSIGDKVRGRMGWAEHRVVQGAELEKLKDYHEPHSRALNVLSFNGVTAYFGVTEILKPKPGEIVYVSTGAGAVGAVVGMLAKRAGCMVIGSAGTNEKLEYMRSIGYDHVFNYKLQKVEDALAKFAPYGIHCYFDNVGGDDALAAVLALCDGGRVAVCGCMHMYNAESYAMHIASKLLCNSSNTSFWLRKAVFLDFVLGLKWAYKQPQPTHTLQVREGRTITWRSFNVIEFKNQAQEAEAKLAAWIADGSLPSAGREDVIIGGLDVLGGAFARMLRGENQGKQCVELVHSKSSSTIDQPSRIVGYPLVSGESSRPPGYPLVGGSRPPGYPLVGGSSKPAGYPLVSSGSPTYVKPTDWRVNLW